MKKKNLSICLRVFFPLTLLFVFLSAGPFHPTLKLFAGYLYMAVALPTFYFIVSTVMSSIALPIFKGQSLEFFETQFVFFSLVLTQEAKKEWREYIAHLKSKNL